jgi:DNA repair exonuclease SbcCD nuclease subunit
MRIAHLADTHLGYRRWHYTDPASGRNQREADVYRVFHQAVDKAIELEVDVVVHAGDLFEAYHPSTYALGVALDGFAKLRDAGIPSAVIAGNHSTPRDKTAAHVFSVLERFGTSAIFKGPETVRFGDLSVTGIPHQSDKELLLQQIQEAKPDRAAKFNLLVLHVGLEGLPAAGSREVSAIELDPEALEEGAAFDYVALGHLHTHGSMNENSWYAGSLERLGFYDDAAEKGFALVDLSRVGQDGFVEFVPTSARRSAALPPVDVTGQEDLLCVVASKLSNTELKDSVVRLPLVGVEQSAWRALDRTAVDELTRPCLHFELVPEFVGTAHAPVGGQLDLHEFIAKHAPEGLDVDKLIARSTEYMDGAALELQQEVTDG